MNEPGDNLGTLMEEVHAGSDSAARRLVELYGDEIRRAARSRLNAKLRARFDTIDFTQEAWKSFFAGVPERPRFKSAAQLVAFIKRLAGNKVIDEVRRQLYSDKRDIKREQAIGETQTTRMLASKAADPAEVIADREELSHQLHRLSPRDRQIIEFRLAGHSIEKIAEHFGIHARSVRRVFARIRRRAKQ